MPDVSRKTQRRWLVAGAVLINLAFLPYHWLPGWLEGLVPAVLILVAPAPILAAFACGGGPLRGLWLVVVWFGGGGVWLIPIDPQLGVAVWLFMVATFSVWGLLLGALCGAARERLGPRGVLLWSPALWVGWELLRTYTALGTPWCSLAHAWWKLPALLQPCELTGFRGLSFVIACFASAAALWLLRLPGARGRFALALGLTAGCWFYGLAFGARWRHDDGAPVRVALVQANVPLRVKQSDEVPAMFMTHLTMSRAVEPPVDVIVWPETAVPAQIFALSSYVDLMAGLAREKRAVLVATGADVVPPDDPKSDIFTNAAVVYGPDGRRLGHYHKVHLVLLGEYLPGRDLPGIRALAELAPQYYAGWEFRPVATPKGVFGLPICYESIFPGDVRRMVRLGAEAVFMMTNDDELTEIGGRQHYQQAVFRAIELRRWTARCANCGISAVIDPGGRVLDQTGWDEQVTLRGMVHRRTGLTVYARAGDWFAWLCLAAVAVAAAVEGKRRPMAK